MNWRQAGLSLRQTALINQHRFLVVVSGNPIWGAATARELLHETAAIWISDNPELDAIPPTRAGSILGQDIGSVVYDGHGTVHPDALGIASGTIQAGGLFVLLTPDLAIWQPADADRIDSWYLYRLAKEIQLLTNESAGKSAFLIKENSHPDQIDQSGTGCKAVPQPPLPTDDQNKAIAQIIDVVRGQRRRPTILVADRGRGKSAAMGIAAKRLVESSCGKVIVTAGSRAASDNVFGHAEHTSSETHDANDQLVWRSVNQLLEQPEQCQILLIDEAAGIPLPQLQALLQRYPRIAMSTTVHGYEGTGRGFMLRFRKILDHNTRGWRHCTLDIPIRWAPGDPLEQQSNHLLVMNAALAKTSELVASIDAVNQETRVIHISKRQLVENETLLQSIFSLLVLAHYRTRPEDLRQLLDNPRIHVYIMGADSAPESAIGVALVVDESDLSLPLQQEIHQGVRRPPGYMLPEILLGLLGMKPREPFRVARIMRIVVHPYMQGKGYGSILLQQLHQLLAANFDLCGVNYALEPQLVGFWRKNHYRPVRVGINAGRDSGAPSGVMLNSLSTEIQSDMEAIGLRFAANFADQLKTTHRNLDPDIVYQLMLDNTDFLVTLSDLEIDELKTYCLTQRTAESVPATLTASLIHAIAVGQSPKDGPLLIERVLQFKSWQDCNALSGEEGKTAGNRRLKTAFNQLFQQLFATRIKSHSSNRLS